MADSSATSDTSKDAPKSSSSDSATTGFRATLANSIIPDDVYERRIFHIHHGSRFVNFSCVDSLTAMTWENEMTEFYLTRAYTRNQACCHHPMISALYNQTLAALWVIKVNIECGTATPDECEFWSNASRAIIFQSLPVQPPLFALLSTIQPHTPKDDRFGRITPKMWTDVRSHPLNNANHHLAPGIHKYLNPDFHGILSGCKRMVEGVSVNHGTMDFNFFHNLDSTDNRPANPAANNLPMQALNEGVGSPRHREFGLIPGYGTYRTPDGQEPTLHRRRILMNYFQELYLPRPDNVVAYDSVRAMLFMDRDTKWLTNLANHMMDACSFYKDRFTFNDLKVTDDSNITLEMENSNVPDFYETFRQVPLVQEGVPQVTRNIPEYVAAPPATYGALNDFVNDHPAQEAARPDHNWALRLRTQYSNQLREHHIYSREKDVPQIHRKNAFIYGVYAPVQTVNQYIGWDETSDGEFFTSAHNPRRYSYDSEDPSRVIKQIIKASLYTRSQDLKSTHYQK